jgi:hypothetical protein
MDRLTRTSRRRGACRGDDVLVVSTHFDDAVLSLWSVVDGPGEVTVLTVFTEGPKPGVIADWDRDTGVDSATRMRQRADENRAALALARREPLDLGLKEAIYGGQGVDAERLRAELEGADDVYIPAGVGVEHVNSEHVLVRDACLAVRGDCLLYADQPYSLFRDDTVLPPGVGSGLCRHVIALTADQRARKAEAIASYAGEVPKLERAFGPLTDPARLVYEVAWV